MKYLCVIERETHPSGRVSFGGYCLDISANVVSKPTREEVIESLREGIALSRLSLEEDGLPVPAPTSTESEVVTESEDDELIWLEPAEVNPISLEIEHAIKKAGFNQAELARRLGVHRSQVTRMVDPFYFGHNISTLQRIAEAIGGHVEVKLVV